MAHAVTIVGNVGDELSVTTKHPPDTVYRGTLEDSDSSGISLTHVTRTTDNHFMGDMFVPWANVAYVTQGFESEPEEEVRP